MDRANGVVLSPLFFANLVLMSTPVAPLSMSA